MTMHPSIRRMGRIWSFFLVCGLFGALGPAAFSSSLGETAPAAAAVAAPVAAAPDSGSLASRAVSFLGLFALVGLCWLMSTDRKKINWKLVAWGMGLQILFGVIVLKTEPGLWFFQKLN